MTTPQWPAQGGQPHPAPAGAPVTDGLADPPTDPHGWPAAGPYPGPYQYQGPYGPNQPWYGQQLPPAQVESPPTHKWGFGAFLLAEAVFLGFSLLVPFVLVSMGLADPDAPLSATALLISLAVPTVLAAVVALVVTKVRGNGPVRDLRLRFGWRDIGIGVACGVSGVIITIPLAELWVWWVGEENANSAVGQLFDGLRTHPVLAALVFCHVWLIAPLCEEILYRGLLWGAMERRNWNRWVILTVSTVVFAVAHFERRAPLLLAIALPMGLARLISGRLPASVVAHQINNFLPGLGLMLLLLGVPLTES